MAEWHATPSLQTVIPIWNHLSVIQDLGLRIVICIGLPIVSVNLIFGSIMLPKCWMGGMRLYTPLMKLLKKVKRTSFLNLQSFKSFNNAREFIVHLGKKKMPLLLKFVYSEKATKVCKIFTVDLTGKLALHKTNLWWRFCKILWPSQNIWTLPGRSKVDVI